MASQQTFCIGRQLDISVVICRVGRRNGVLTLIFRFNVVLIRQRFFIIRRYSPRRLISGANDSFSLISRTSLPIIERFK